MSAKPPLINSLTHPITDVVHRSSLHLHERSMLEVHQQAVLLLSCCLSLVYHNNTLSILSPGDPDHITNELRHYAAPNTNFASHWTSLWLECQKWYDNRPLQVQPILEARGFDVDRIDSTDGSAFPILVYTTPLALFSNAVYHITALVLLLHKPRLMKNVAGPKCFVSHTWHAQSVAGIATSNDAPEQWHPIVVAGLLLSARQMTHESQQTVLLERLDTVRNVTGLNLDTEVNALRATWDISRYGT